MRKFNVKGAIERAKENGIKINKTELAKRLWSSSSQQTQRANMTNLVNGSTTSIKVEWIEIICQVCQCTPNYLFGYEQYN